MGRWRDYDNWGYYPESTPRHVEGGIKAHSERGAIGKNWWSKRWVQALEALGLGTRLTRGRTYARMGQVLSLVISPGQVSAQVQGSRPRPYKVTIRLQPFSDSSWERVTDAMASQAIFVAKLLAGEMPTNIEEAFDAVNISLFPETATDLETDCSCPDWANPCKHIAAVYYILAEQFDEDPFLIFKLRGCTRDAILETLRKKRATSLSPAGDHATIPEETPHRASQPPLRLEDHISTFWQAGAGLDAFAVNPQPPNVEKAILKRLGEPFFSSSQQKVAPVLSEAYDTVQAAIQRKTEELQADVEL